MLLLPAIFFSNLRTTIRLSLAMTGGSFIHQVASPLLSSCCLICYVVVWCGVSGHQSGSVPFIPITVVVRFAHLCGGA